ncbi:hydrogenase maturation protein HypF [Magnetovibrio sp.]|uniref:Kae1-like domain-containing protein n=1 Tax=Magnetovibrio sp. TaxID=2024836 RepID=UPI002F946049
MVDADIATVIDLDRSYSTVLGVGAHLKASLCLIKGDKAFVTVPAGDMETLEAVELYERLLNKLLDMAGGNSEVAACAHDLHRDFHSTQSAQRLGCPTIAVQHHHAHIASVTAEHGCDEPLLGLALDGFGLGPGDQSWGGELLVVDGAAYERFGGLHLLAQPGGDVAAREPWRMGAAALYALGRGDEIAAYYPHQPHAAMLSEMIERNLNSPKTSSCGRLFDAACGLLKVCEVSEFEGQAPMALEAMVASPDVLDGGWAVTADNHLDMRGLLAALVGMEAPAGANLFHGTLIAALSDWVLRARERTGLNAVGLSGGCFFNAVVKQGLTVALEGQGMKVLSPELLSPGDAGLSFGQAMVAALSVMPPKP